MTEFLRCTIVSFLTIFVGLQQALSESSEEPQNAENVAHPNIPDLAEIENHILQQLRCLESPEPIFTFLALERIGKINQSESVGYDGISCFRIHGGIEVNGLKFLSVCGHSEDRLVRQLYPDWLWRGPGTSPGQFISFGTGANFETTAKWYAENLLISRFLNQAIKTENTSMGDKTAVTCSNWMRY